MSRRIRKMKFNDPRLLRNREMGLLGPLNHRYYVRRSIGTMLKDFHSTGVTNDSVTCVEFSPSGKSLVIGYDAKRIGLIKDVLMDSPQNKVLYADTKTTCTLKIVFISEYCFARSSESSEIQLWDTRNFKNPIKILRDPEIKGKVQDLQYVPKLRVLFALYEPKHLMAWGVHREGDRNPSALVLTDKLSNFVVSEDVTMLLMARLDGIVTVVRNMQPKYLHKDLPHFWKTKKNPSRGSYNIIDNLDDFHRENNKRRFTSLTLHPDNKCVITKNFSYNQVYSDTWLCTLKLDDYKCDEYEDDMVLSTNFDSDSDQEYMKERSTPWKKSLLRLDYQDAYSPTFRKEPCFTKDGKFFYDIGINTVRMFKTPTEIHNLECLSSNYQPLHHQLIWIKKYYFEELTAVRFNSDYNIMALGFQNGKVVLKQPKF